MRRFVNTQKDERISFKDGFQVAPQEITSIGLADSSTGIRHNCFWTGFCPSSSAPRPVLEYNRNCPRLFSQGRPSTNRRLGGRKWEPSHSGSQHCEVSNVKRFLRFSKAVASSCFSRVIESFCLNLLLQKICIQILYGQGKQALLALFDI